MTLIELTVVFSLIIENQQVFKVECTSRCALFPANVCMTDLHTPFQHELVTKCFNVQIKIEVF